MKQISSENEKKRALDILEKAFQCSPGITWMIGKERSQKKIRIFLSMFLLEASVREGAFLTEDNNGVVLFFQLQKNRFSFRLFLKKLYVFLFMMGVKRGFHALKYKKTINSIRPKTGWLGWLVATDNEAESKSAAYEIKQWMFNKGDETNETVFVETTVPRVRILYLKAGYKEYAKIKHPYQNLEIWFLKREPQLN